ncbi:pre-mRNA-processing factor 17-like isoform X2 [Aphidius gifuensis]|uniref:pre-mRNA-processing factor 17-like isoform X2 n=1 Tax=Aphidius gifuensis TaxID=684658 RepID=UPI001CDC6D9F|nr:pre-mRNA-processing factor 17-like isoform X2 [Aphidius gifuensis]
MWALKAYESTDDESDNDNETKINTDHNNIAGTSKIKIEITSTNETESTDETVTSLSLNNFSVTPTTSTDTNTNDNNNQKNIKIEDDDDLENDFVSEQKNITKIIISGYSGESSSTNGTNSANEKSRVKKRKKTETDDESDHENVNNHRIKTEPTTEDVNNHHIKTEPLTEDELIIEVEEEEQQQNQHEESFVRKLKQPKMEDDIAPIDGTALHIADPIDNQGRSFLHPPLNIGVNIPIDLPIEHTFLPKRTIHTWEGHLKGVSQIRFFPKTAHLLLSCGNDHTVKLWEVYKERRCIRTYRNNDIDNDINFDNDGTHFLSGGNSRYIRLWDTETGVVINRFTNDKIPYCIKFNPDKDKQNLFLSGSEDYKIICWDIRSGDIAHEYNKHTNAVNTITFFDNNQKFITTSEDKTLRIWEWGIPVDIKCINDSSLPVIKAVALSKNNKLLACQSMENKIYSFCLKRYKVNHKKTFTGHTNIGHTCSIDYSPNMYYLVSGDADGKCHIWNSKTTQNLKSWKAHDGVCNTVLWNPHDPSKLVTAGSDSHIKYWE